MITKKRLKKFPLTLPERFWKKIWVSLPPTGVKKTLAKYGYIEIINKHELSNGMNGFQISPLSQKLMIYFGQLEC